MKSWKWLAGCLFILSFSTYSHTCQISTDKAKALTEEKLIKLMDECSPRLLPEGGLFIGSNCRLHGFISLDVNKDVHMALDVDGKTLLTSIHGEMSERVRARKIIFRKMKKLCHDN